VDKSDASFAITRVSSDLRNGKDWLKAAMSQGKTHRTLIRARDASHRLLIRRLADALEIMTSEGFKPICGLRAITGKTLWYGGRWGAVGCIFGETEAETFSIGLPISSHFVATISDGSRKRFPISHFDDAFINEDGSVRLYNKLPVSQGAFKTIKLTFELSELQKDIAKLTIEFLNETNISRDILGRNLSLNYIDYAGLAAVELDKLDPVAKFIASRWDNKHERNRPPPTRETIASTLAALSIRPLKRGRHSIRDTILPHCDLRKEFL
jgi:hypothetical protein